MHLCETRGQHHPLILTLLIGSIVQDMTSNQTVEEIETVSQQLLAFDFTSVASHAVQGKVFLFQGSFQLGVQNCRSNAKQKKMRKTLFYWKRL